MDTVNEILPPLRKGMTPWLITAALVVVTFLAYRNVGLCGFVNFDDDAYIEFNPMVNQGIRSAALVWAFTGAHAGMWHPLTTLSHMVDCEIFGIRAAPMHWENLGWHLINVILVFLVWRALTGATWRPALIAALFALHPLNVESVAWLAERKNLLSTCFWMLSIGSYAAYVRRSTGPRYILVLFCFALAGMAKPMTVTFPATLLLLDYWPLCRWPTHGWRKLLIEKIPFFVLSVALSIGTVLAQHSIGADNYGKRFSLGERLGNAVVSYARYIGKIFWPKPLAPFYPHPGHWPLWGIVSASVLLVVICILAWRRRHQEPWFIFGWLWFLGTLVPVIGLVQVGAQAMADRYSYVPQLGIFTICVYSGTAISTRFAKKLRFTLMAASVMALWACYSETRRQMPAWETSIQLYQHSIAAGEDNATLRFLLASAMQSAGQPESEVVAQYRRAIELQPNYINAYTRLSLVAIQHGRWDEAQQLVEQTIQFEPNNPALYKNLGAIFERQGRLEEARALFKETIRRRPNYADGHHELAWLAQRENRLDEAQAEFQAVLKSEPWDFSTMCELGLLFGQKGMLKEARQCFERAKWINPQFQNARDNLKILDEFDKTRQGATVGSPL